MGKDKHTRGAGKSPQHGTKVYETTLSGIQNALPPYTIPIHSLNIYHDPHNHMHAIGKPLHA